jgi:sugar (pentulose or hexulose) kinase
MAKHYLAVDLGASSGRTIIGTLKNGTLTIKEINRFWNGPTEINGTLYWDFVHLFRNIQDGIALAKKEFGSGLVSMGVATWGVDFGLIDGQGKLLGNPVNYRDARTNGMTEKVFAAVGKETVFQQTGIQFMQINTLYQLYSLAQSKDTQYLQADKLLFVPDLLNYWLTGKMATNRTFASTSQFYNPVTKDWAFDLLKKLRLRTDFFAPFADPGTVLGSYLGLPVVNVGSHDTASAFAAVPVVQGEQCAFLSSGTWSLLGTELPAPVINDNVLTANFTNEVGVCDTIRFLKNLSGLWIMQELRRVWAEQGADYTWDEMAEMALLSEPFQFFINPGDEAFIAPGNMPARIQDYCERTGQKRPQEPGQIMRAAYEGLALLYADTYGTLEQLSGKKMDVLRIVGGGCQNKTLSQFAADATGRTVVTGPVEATAIGNIVMQMLAMGDIASLDAGRAIIRDSFAHESKTYHPQNVDAWKAALEKWRSICR